MCSGLPLGVIENLLASWWYSLGSYLKDYATLPFIALDRETYSDYWQYLDQLCQERDVSLEPAHEVKEKHSLLALVAGGMGVSILPAHIAETARDSLRILPIEDLLNEIPIVAAFQRSLGQWNARLFSGSIEGGGRFSQDRPSSPKGNGASFVGRDPVGTRSRLRPAAAGSRASPAMFANLNPRARHRVLGSFSEGGSVVTAACEFDTSRSREANILGKSEGN